MAVLRLATFNLLHGVSLRDGSATEAALREAATTLDADVVGLQEVDRRQPRSGGVDQAAVVAAALEAPAWRFTPSVLGTPGWQRTWIPATTDDGGAVDGPSYGVALVSRLPVREWLVTRFPAAPLPMPLAVAGRRGLVLVPDEPRIALAAVLEGPAGPFTAITAHLSFVPGWNIRQLRAIVEWSRAMPAPRVLLGDLNLPGPVPAALSRWAPLARVATYPTLSPRVQFDHVLADGIGLEDVHAARSLPLAVSDHCALAVDVEV